MNTVVTEIKNLLKERGAITLDMCLLSTKLASAILKIKSAMVSLVPDDLKQIVGNECIVETLVDYGAISSKLRLSDYDLKTTKDAKEIIERLIDVWKDFVELEKKIDMSEPHRISYKLKLKVDIV